jgi:hypothetical protein
MTRKSPKTIEDAIEKLKNKKATLDLLPSMRSPKNKIMEEVDPQEGRPIVTGRNKKRRQSKKRRLGNERVTRRTDK